MLDQNIKLLLLKYLSAVPGDRAERAAVNPQVAQAQLDRVRVSDPEASVGD
jgi:hypothetical protein